MDARAARWYWRISAPLLILVASVGFLLVARGKSALLGSLLVFDTPHNVLHAALGVGALVLALPWISARWARSAAGVVGIAYLALAVLGFLSGRLFGLGPLVGLHLELGENVLHLALGAAGAYAGFGEAKK